MRVHPLWSALSLLLLCAQAPAQELSVEQILAGLIERTNALESFRVVYDVEVLGEDSEQTGTAELVFQAPDVARLRFERETQEAAVWLLGTKLYVQTGEESWMRATLPEPPSCRKLLDELFPPDPRALGAGIAFILDVHDDPADELAAFKVSFTHSHVGNPALLRWLMLLEQRSAEVELLGEELVSRGGAFELRVSAVHGFPTFIEAETATGRFVIRLRECSLDEPQGESLLQLPRAAREAEFDPDLVRGLINPDSLGLVRRGAFARVGRRLREGDLVWDSDLQELWSSFLDGLHRQTVEDGVAPIVELTQGWIDEVAAQAHASAGRCETDQEWATLAQWVESQRASLVEELGGESANYLGLFPALDLAGAELEPLRGAEAALISDLFHELLIDPLLERFDEAVDIDAHRGRPRGLTPLHAGRQRTDRTLLAPLHTTS